MIFSVKLLILSALTLVSQEIPKDTSYSLHSAYHKIRMSYPGISIPKVEVSDGIIARYDLDYRVIDTRTLKADVFYPVQPGKKFPGILMIHGGGWRTGDKSLMKNMAISLAHEGYSVTCAEYRLSLEARYPAAVYDLKAAISWMREKSEELSVDTSKIAVLGCSAGGQLATLIGVTGDRKLVEENFNPFSSSVHAIIDVDGVLAFRHPDSQESKMAADWLGGTSGSIPGVWDEASALTHVDAFTPPTLFLASKHPRFLAGRQEYSEVLKSNGTLVETRFLGDAPHSFWLVNPWFEPTINYIIEFLKQVFE